MELKNRKVSGLSVRVLSSVLLLISFIFLSWGVTAKTSKPIFHTIYYPVGEGPFLAVMVLHSSGGHQTILSKVSFDTQAGYVVYAPDFLKGMAYLR